MGNFFPIRRNSMKNKPLISKNMVYRVPLYLTVARNLATEGHKYITAPMIAKVTTINVETVKKDLSIICTTPGHPRMGRDAQTLVEEIVEFGVYTQLSNAVLIGAGSLGHALLSYQRFNDWGLNISAGFDINPELIGTVVNNIHVYSLDQLQEIVKSKHAEIAIITVPAEAAQHVVDLVIAAGIKAIWNFSPTHLNVPKNIILQNENMASSLSLLNYHLKVSKQKIKKPRKTKK